MTIRCSSCGHPNEDGATFCASCNHYLAWSSPADRPADRSDAGTPAPTPAPAPSPTPAPAADAAGPAVAVRPRTAERTAPHAPAAADPAHDLQTALQRARALAVRRSRSDLVQRLDTVRDRVRATPATVAVVGEFKRGKSTLVNALVQRTVCPVDADIVTAVPTLVRYGEQPSASVCEVDEGRDDPEVRVVPWDQLTAVVSESPASRRRQVRSVEVTVPHRMLRSGLRLLDTPGVGGLDSAHGQLTLGSLDGADGVLFVTDAFQELTAPELDFLRSVLERCARAVVVVTKTDLQRHWRTIVDLDRGHLGRAGIDLPILPVSSFLRLRAAGRPELNDESGFGALVEFLARDVVRPVLARAAAEAAHEVDFVAEQLATESDTERVVLARPQDGASVVQRLSAATGRAHALSAPSATWQQVLNDGVQDLVADVEHDLNARLRQVLKDARDVIDESDPRDTWATTGAWLRRQVAAAAVANRDLLVTRAGELTDTVASAFQLASGEAVDVQRDVVTGTLKELRLPAASGFSMPGGRLASLIVTARTTALVPMMAISLLSWATLPAVVVVGGAILAGTGIGTKLLRDEGRRQREYRRQQAKAAAAKFVEEAGFELNKETRDALRRTQRALRDDFTQRALTVHASAAGALASAQRVTDLDPAARRARATELEAEAADLGAVRSSMRSLSGGRRDG